MGKPAGRLGDIGSNHGAWHPSPITSGSGDVFINGKPAARVGDSLAPHTKPKNPPHGRSIAAGASQVFINGKPAARVGDAISCGGTISSGSGNVFIGDSPVLNSPSDASLPDIDFEPQQGRASSYQTEPSKPASLDPSEKVKIDEPPPEFKDAMVRLDINPANHLFSSDQFILSSTDGAVNITRTVADDQVPGDDYLDLLFPELDTSKSYRLQHIDGTSGEMYTYFDNASYSAIGTKSSPEDESDTSKTT